MPNLSLSTTNEELHDDFRSQISDFRLIVDLGFVDSFQ